MPPQENEDCRTGLTAAGGFQPAGCPNCGRAFLCGATTVTPCACAAVPLDDAARATLRQRFPGCLCLDCLREYARAAQGGAPRSAGNPR